MIASPDCEQEESGEELAEGHCELEFLEMTLVEPPPTLSSSAREKIHSE